MPEIPTTSTQPFSRKACLSDFFDDDDTNTKNKYKNHSQNDMCIEKNQQEFGNRKRIKP